MEFFEDGEILYHNFQNGAGGAECEIELAMSRPDKCGETCYEGDVLRVTSLVNAEYHSVGTSWTGVLAFSGVRFYVKGPSSVLNLDDEAKCLFKKIGNCHDKEFEGI